MLAPRVVRGVAGVAGVALLALTLAALLTPNARSVGLSDGAGHFLLFASLGFMVGAYRGAGVRRGVLADLLLLLAGLQTIPAEVYEAARVDGAGAWRRFTSVTLPLLRPAILVALVFRTLDALRVFDLARSKPLLPLLFLQRKRC